MATTASRARTITRAFLSLLAVSAAALISTAPASAAQSDRCPGSLNAPSAGTTDDATDALVCLINAERTSRGMKALHRDGDLGQAARGHSSDMVKRDYFSHVTPGGADLGDRVRGAGYGRGHGWKAGEALGWGTGSMATPAALVDEWLASPPHRHILLDSSYRELGVGIAPGAPRPVGSGLAGATYTVDVGVVR